MKIIIDITEAQALGLGYLAGIDSRSRKNYIENELKRHLYANEDMIDAANIRRNTRRSRYLALRVRITTLKILSVARSEPAARPS